MERRPTRVMPQMNRRDFFSGLAAAGLALLWPGGARALGPEDRFTLATLVYAGNYDPRPAALGRLLREVEKRTSVQVAPNPVSIDPASPALFEHPFVVLAGDRRFDPLPEAAIDNLRTFLKSGGFLLVDSAEGVSDGPFLDSVKRELARIFPGRELARVPRDHVVYKSFFLIDRPVGRLIVADDFDAIFEDDRLAVVLSRNDMQGAWARDNFGSWKYECTPGGERQREMALRLGINLVMYALCINYKADQVHVPFILKRRKWRVGR